MISGAWKSGAWKQGRACLPFLLTLPLLAACQSGAIPAAPPATQAAAPRVCERLGATPDVQLTLMFGMLRPHGGPISEKEWQDFLATVITPRFPAGLSVSTTLGQWQDRETGRIGTEPSRLVWIVTTNTPDLPEKVAAIRSTYRTRFDQQAVGLAVVPGCASF